MAVYLCSSALMGDLVKGVWYVCAKGEEVFARRSGTVKIEGVINKVLRAR